MSNLNNELNNLNDDFVKFNLNKQNINLANSLNGQLSKLDLDYNNHKEFVELKNNISNNGSRNDINNRLNDINQINYMSNNNNNLNNNNLNNNNNYNNTNIYNNNINNNHNNNSNNNFNNKYNQDNEDYKNTMNEKMGQMRFENNFMKNTLVPVNMEHIYSGNIFHENPIPFDMMNNQEMNKEFNQSNQFSQNNNIHNMNIKKSDKRVYYQPKSKHFYKDDVNNRLNNFSPLGRTLYFPINGEVNNEYNKQNNKIKLNNLPQSSHNINYNNSNNSNNSNNNNNYNDINNVPKIKYQDFMPVSSN
tara:strand:+ start:858 stop:1769 length:912 start_codon:yes stop_codon:yes gene_type:complete